MPRRRSDRRRVLILTGSFGGVQSASGDAIARYLRTRHCESLDVECVDLLEHAAPALNVLARLAFQQSPEFFPSFRGTFAEMSEALGSNPAVHELAKGGLEKAFTLLKQWRPDAVISTHPFAAGVAAESKTVTPFVSAALLTDYHLAHAWLHPETDLYFVSVREVREELVVKGIPWDRIVVSGIPLRGDLVDVMPDSGELGLADRFTATLAGPWMSDSRARDLAAELVSLSIQVAVYAAGSEKTKRRLAPTTGQRGLVKLFEQPSQLPALVRATGALVTSAGSEALAEGLSAGAAVVVYNPVPGHELRNVDFLVNYGAILAARSDGDAIEKVRFLSAHPERASQLAENAAVLGRRSAVQTVGERVFAAIR